MADLIKAEPVTANDGSDDENLDEEDPNSIYTFHG